MSSPSSRSVSLRLLVTVPPETNMQPTTDIAGPLGGGSALGELLRAWVLFLASVILIGGLGLAVVRRARV